MLITPERVCFRSKDGTRIATLLFEPHQNIGSRRRSPAVIWVHGGPELQDGYRLDLWAQYLASHGYVVFEPNYRGSAGYGERFRNLNVIAPARKWTMWPLLRSI